MERDILVELNDTIEWRLSGQRDKRTANGEENHGHIDVENKSGGSRNHIRRSKRVPGYLEVLLDGVVDEAKGEDDGMKYNEDENKTATVSKLGPSAQSYRKAYILL